MRSLRLLPITICAISIQIVSIFAGCVCPTEPAHISTRVERVRIWPLDNSGPQPVEPTSNAIPARALVLVLNVERKDTLFSSFLRTIAPAIAWAMGECPIMPPIYEMLDTIASTEVIRVDASGAEREVGSSFMVGMPPVDIEAAVGSFSRFDQLIEILNGGRDTEATAIYEPHMRGTFLYLREGFDAMKGSDVRFIVRIGLTNGTMVADTTDPLTIL